MYCAHFGLGEPPFGITPDTGFYYPCSRHQAALNTLLVAARNGEGFIKVTGEVGTGKTLLCRKFLASLEERFSSAYIPNPYLEPHTLLLALADELEVELDPDLDQHRLLKALTAALMDFAAAGRPVVLCLDEAQAMPGESLEALRLLTNLETEKRKLLQVVLFGQPELDRRLEQPAVRQLKQRITFHYYLGPLTRPELDAYVAHRLSVAGCEGGLFDLPARRLLYLASGGVPRLVNILAHKAMLAAFGEGARLVTARHVREAAADTPAARNRMWLKLGAVADGLARMPGGKWGRRRHEPD
jgi:MSHA biogenesis protein MshM